MKEYSRDCIRNIALVAPHGAGKTSLAEAILYTHGATDKLGKVDDGSSVLDYEPEEKHRRMSINSHITFFETRSHLVNLIDTPGFLNFLYEAENAVKAADGVVLVAGAVGSAESGLQLKKYWDLAGGLPSMIFVNKLDKENTSFEATVSGIAKELSGVKVIPLTLPIGEQHDFKGIVDLVDMKAYAYDGTGGAQEIPVPDDMMDAAAAAREEIIETVAELDDDLLEKYLDGEPVDEDKITTLLHEGILDGRVVPVFFGSATGLVGLNVLSGAITRYMPSPLERKPLKGCTPREAKRKSPPVKRGRSRRMCSRPFRTRTRAR